MEKYSYEIGEVIKFLMDNSTYHAIANNGTYTGMEIIYNPSMMRIEWEKDNSPVTLDGELILTVWSVENYEVKFNEAIMAIKNNKTVCVQVFEDNDNYTKDFKPEDEVISLTRKEMNEGFWYIQANN
jgi:hypothetical protein